MKHLQQETDYSCAAACLAMVCNIPEAKARELAGTKTTGTQTVRLAPAARELGHEAHYIRLQDQPLDQLIWALELQSMYWPLILSLDFQHGRIGLLSRRKFKAHRYHAVVLWQGMVYDPGETQLLPVECLGHLADRGLVIRDYTIVVPLS